MKNIKNNYTVKCLKIAIIMFVVTIIVSKFFNLIYYISRMNDNFVLQNTAQEYYEFLKLNLSFSIVQTIYYIPHFIALIYGWKILTQIGNDNLYSKECVNNTKKMFCLSLFSVLFLTINYIIIIVLNRNWTEMVIASITTISISIVITLMLYIAYTQLKKVKELKEESELTI